MPTITEKDTPKEFRNNVGKTGQTFKESTGFGGKPHPFIAIAKNEAKESEVNKLFFKLQQAKAINKLVEKTTTHADIVNKIEFNKTSLKHAFNQPHKKYDLKNQMLPFIDTLIPKSEYLGFSKFKESDAFAGSHIFKTVIDNVESYIIVRETKWGKLVFYAISDSKKVALNLKK
jgi:hypothetical protein